MFEQLQKWRNVNIEFFSVLKIQKKKENEVTRKTETPTNK